jgi:hypothetical protein
MVGTARLELALACFQSTGAIRYSTSRKWWGRWDSNPRLPASDAGGQSTTLLPLGVNDGYRTR